MSDDDSFLTKVVENLQRNVEINPLAEAKGYIVLIDHGWTINRIAQRIGKSDSYVSDRIGLVRRLDPALAEKANGNGNEHLKPSHLELLARLRSKQHQLELSSLVERKRFSVGKLEKPLSGGQPLRETVEQKGRSLYVRLPKEMADHLDIEAGDSVYVYAQSRRRITIEPVSIEKTHLMNRATATVPA